MALTLSVRVQAVQFDIIQLAWYQRLYQALNEVSYLAWFQFHSSPIIVGWNMEKIALIQVPDMSYTLCDTPIFLNFQKIKKKSFSIFFCVTMIWHVYKQNHWTLTNTPHNTKFNKIPL